MQYNNFSINIKYLKTTSRLFSRQYLKKEKIMNYINLAKILLLISFFLVGISTKELRSQGSEKYRLAESFEKSGDFQNASRLYYELYLLDKRNKNYFAGVVRTYKAQNNFSALIPIVEEQIVFNKNSENYSLLGELLWRIGKPEEANNAWENAINTAPNLEKTYLDVYQSQSLVFQFEKAIATLIKGRNELSKISKNNNKTLYSEQLTQLYIASGNYIKGIEEILLLFESTQDYSIAQGKIAALMYNKQAIDYIENYLKDRSKSNQAVLRLYSWFLRANKKYEEALQVVIKIDKLSGSTGYEVFNFAYSSMNDGQFDIALSAFSWIIDNSKDKQYYNQALYGYARTIEYKLREKGTLSNSEAKDIIQRYRHIIKTTNYQNNIADAYYRIALLEYEYLSDSASAYNDIAELSKRFAFYPVTATALNLLADIYLTGGNIEDARKTYYDVVTKFKQNNQNEYNNAQYKLAEIEFFTGNIDSAFTLFAQLSSLSNIDIANDALDMLVLFEQNKDFREALIIYGRAKLKAKQKNLGEAEALYEKIAKEYSGSSLAELSLLEIANFRMQTNNTQSSREILLSLLEKYPETIYGDLALMNIATTYEKERNIDQAIATLSQVLAKYPRSIYLQEAREKIRKLRAEKKS